MKGELIQKVSQILSTWNPLGKNSTNYSDLDNYKTEAIDIIFQADLNIRKENINIIVQEIINQAFDLSLSKQDCYKASKQIKKAINQIGF